MITKKEKAQLLNIAQTMAENIGLMQTAIEKVLLITKGTYEYHGAISESGKVVCCPYCGSGEVRTRDFTWCVMCGAKFNVEERGRI